MRLVLVLVVAASIWYGYKKSESEPAATAGMPATSGPGAAPLFKASAAAAYSCDGRTHCSQMTSCAEATFFLQNCPGTKMDGDNDGIACEMQHC